MVGVSCLFSLFVVEGQKVGPLVFKFSSVITFSWVIGDGEVIEHNLKVSLKAY